MFLYIALSISEHLQLPESLERTIALCTYYLPQSNRASRTIKVLDLNSEGRCNAGIGGLDCGMEQDGHTEVVQDRFGLELSRVWVVLKMMRM